MSDPIDFLRKYLHAIEEFAPASVLSTFFTDDVVQQEFPNRLFAGGRRHDLSAMLAASDKGRQILASQRYEMRNALRDGDRVAAEIAWTGPDVLVSDIGMPDVDGHGLLRRVRQLGPQSGGGTPSVALTAYAGADDAERCFASGFQAHLAKPIDPQELVRVVASPLLRVND